ncbi:hypothetical protein BaRGS_00005472 [Batillaria attramentaria]|uniref:Uncharacterized protein n=1 Tax=Batillaria attramentaria TaxID=370345 RepID=A0ABD0LUP2_9CAEN
MVRRHCYKLQHIRDGTGPVGKNPGKNLKHLKCLDMTRISFSKHQPALIHKQLRLQHTQRCPSDGMECLTLRRKSRRFIFSLTPAKDELWQFTNQPDRRANR